MICIGPEPILYISQRLSHARRFARSCGRAAAHAVRIAYMCSVPNTTNSPPTTVATTDSTTITTKGTTTTTLIKNKSVAAAIYEYQTVYHNLRSRKETIKHDPTCTATTATPSTCKLG